MLLLRQRHTLSHTHSHVWIWPIETWSMSGMYTMLPLTQVLRETGERKRRDGQRQGHFCVLLVKQVLKHTKTKCPKIHADRHENTSDTRSDTNMKFVFSFCNSTPNTIRSKRKKNLNKKTWRNFFSFISIIRSLVSELCLSWLRYNKTYKKKHDETSQMLSSCCGERRQTQNH